jgi:hypothetical protein
VSWVVRRRRAFAVVSPKPEPRALTVDGLAGRGSLCLTTDDAGHSELSSHGLRCDPGDAFAAEYNAGIDGMEHLLLALWSVGVEVSADQLRSAMDTATSALAEQFPS